METGVPALLRFKRAALGDGWCMELVVSKCLEALAASTSDVSGAIEKTAELGKALDDDDDAEVVGTTC